MHGTRTRAQRDRPAGADHPPADTIRATRATHEMDAGHETQETRAVAVDREIQEIRVTRVIHEIHATHAMDATRVTRALDAAPGTVDPRHRGSAIPGAAGAGAERARAGATVGVRCRDASPTRTIGQPRSGHLRAGTAIRTTGTRPDDRAAAGAGPANGVRAAVDAATTDPIQIAAMPAGAGVQRAMMRGRRRHVAGCGATRTRSRHAGGVGARRRPIHVIAGPAGGPRCGTKTRTSDQGEAGVGPARTRAVAEARVQDVMRAAWAAPTIRGALSTMKVKAARGASASRYHWASSWAPWCWAPARGMATGS